MLAVKHRRASEYVPEIVSPQPVVVALADDAAVAAVPSTATAIARKSALRCMRSPMMIEG